MLTHTPVIVLSVSPFEEDHEALWGIVRPNQWTLHRVSTLGAAKQFLRTQQITLVVSERNLPPYTWQDLLLKVGAFPVSAPLIVTSYHADDHLWAEALNLGAYSVLSKPFDAVEVRHTLTIAAFLKISRQLRHKIANLN